MVGGPKINKKLQSSGFETPPRQAGQSRHGAALALTGTDTGSDTDTVEHPTPAVTPRARSLDRGEPAFQCDAVAHGAHMSAAKRAGGRRFGILRGGKGRGFGAESL